MRGRLLLMWAASSGCLLRNPDFGVDDASTTGAVAGSADDSGGASTLPSSDGATTSAATGDGTSTTGVPPGEYEVQATVAACVLLPSGQAPFAGPAVCSANATSQNGTALSGLLMIDTSVVHLDGMGRPAYTYLRFDVPEAFSGASIASATLQLQVADGPDDLPNGPQSGVLILTEAFDAATLASAPPQMLQMLAEDQGYVGINEVVTWSIELPFVEPGQPLFLGLLPTDDNGVFYRGATNLGAPVLTLVVQ